MLLCIVTLYLERPIRSVMTTVHVASKAIVIQEFTIGQTFVDTGVSMDTEELDAMSFVLSKTASLVVSIITTIHVLLVTTATILARTRIVHYPALLTVNHVHQVRFVSRVRKDSIRTARQRANIQHVLITANVP